MKIKTTARLKKIFMLTAVVILLLVALYRGFFYADHLSEVHAVQRYRNATRLTTADLQKLQEGDFILRRGFGFFSDYVASDLNTGPIDVTHAGILVKRNSRWQVIHSLSSDVSEIDGVQMQPLDTFLKYSAPDKIIITRAKNCNTTLGCKIGVLADAYLAKAIPFDHKGTIDDDHELFCTELIWKILEKDLQHVQLPKGHEAREKFFYTMMPMYNTQYFDIIINQYEKKNAALHAQNVQ